MKIFYNCLLMKNNVTFVEVLKSIEEIRSDGYWVKNRLSVFFTQMLLVKVW